MPRTEPPALADVLAQMFAVSAERQAGVHRRLSSGLHVKVADRNGKRQIIVWRDGDRLPSGKECEVTGQDAGFVEPKARMWQVGEQQAFLITDTYTGAFCEHTWGFTAHYDEKAASGYTSSCTKCSARWRRSLSRRGSKETYFYNGVRVREAVFSRWLQRGPVPEEKQGPSGVEADLALMDRLVEERRVERAARSAGELRGEACGLCRHGEPEWDGMIACTLGWEAHDGLWSWQRPEKGGDSAGGLPGQWVPSTAAHPGVPRPLLAPQTRCMAVGGRWLPRQREQVAS